MSQLTSLHQQLKQELDSGSNSVSQTLNKLKIELAGLAYLSGEHSLDANQLTTARDVLELGALWSIRSKEIAGFERYVTQLQTYYVDHKNTISPSPRENMILGLQLMNLIAQNRIADFHLGLEGIDPSLFESDPYIRHAVELEKALMEGSYNKVLNHRDQVPAEEFSYFMDILVTTIQNEIASCCEKAYRVLPIQQIASMLFFTKGDDIMAFASQRGWTVNTDHTVQFRPTNSTTSSSGTSSLPAEKILTQTMEYAKELERIV